MSFGSKNIYFPVFTKSTASECNSANSKQLGSLAILSDLSAHDKCELSINPKVSEFK